MAAENHLVELEDIAVFRKEVGSASRGGMGGQRKINAFHHRKLSARSYFAAEEKRSRLVIGDMSGERLPVLRPDGSFKR